jgi:thiamine pyrophosphate-dependent acetolactate synthase large subunit-like protein
MKLTGAQALVRVLAAERISFAFGVVGGKLAPLLHAIQAEQSIHYVGVRHEAAAAMMAAAVFAGSGRMAVALGEMGPGGLNLASGVGTGFNNNLAVLLITTNQHRAAAYPHGGMFMDLDTVAVFKPLTKWNAVVHDPRRMPELVRRAFREALSGRPGPVHLDVPQDVLSAECTFADDEFDLPPARYRLAARPRANAEQIAAAAELLRRARRPIIVAGGGVVVSGADRRLRELARLLEAPVLPTQMALGAVATDSRFYIGQGGIIGGDAVREAFERSDTIVGIGCRFSSWTWDQHGPLARRHHRLININIDPAALGAPAPHEIALHADADLALGDLIAELGDADNLAVEKDWLPRLRRLRLDYEHGLEQLARESSAVMHPAALASAVAAAIPRDAIVVYDGGHTTFWSNDFTPGYEVRTRFHDPGMSQLGFGLPYALSLQLQHPDRPVINLTGDGAFGFTLQELDTARRYRLPVVNVIHNNAAWGVIQAGQRAQLDFELGTSLAGTDYASIARGFGCLGETVTTPDDVAPALTHALTSGLPSVIDCRTRFVPHPCLPAFERMNQYGFESPAGQPTASPT